MPSPGAVALLRANLRTLPSAGLARRDRAQLWGGSRGPKATSSSLETRPQHSTARALEPRLPALAPFLGMGLVCLVTVYIQHYTSLVELLSTVVVCAWTD